MRTSTSIRLLAGVVVFVLALTAALLLLSRGSSESLSTVSSRDGGSKAATSEIWKVGDAWTVKVNQDAGAISPGGERNVAAIPFRFEVAKAPKDASDTWLVKVSQDGAEGPAAAGWKLQYREADGNMHLYRVAVGSEPALEAELASIVLGMQFPYEVSYSKPPTDKTVNADDLMDRAQLPPGDLPDGAPSAPSGATPPAEAPKLSTGGAPDAG